MPTVSVVIPTFNRAHLITCAIKSILAQTYQDFEIIVVDDGSLDETEKSIQKCEDNRIKYIKHQKTKGPGAARNSGIDASSGDYIAFLDSDDEWLPTKLEKQVNLFKKDAEKTGLVYCGVELINQCNRIVIERWIPKNRGYVFEKNLSANFIVSGSSTVMVRRDVLKKTGRFDESLPSCEDWDLWIRIAKYCKFDFVPEILVNCFAHPQRISSNFKKVIEGLTLFSKKYQKEIDKQRNSIKAKHFFYLGNHFCYYGDANLAKKYLSKAFNVYPINPIYFFFLIFFTFFGPKVYTSLSSLTRPLRHKIFRGG